MVNHKVFELYAPKVAVKLVKDEIKQAIAWGRPDNESTGYSSAEFIQILRLALTVIEELEK